MQNLPIISALNMEMEELLDFELVYFYVKDHLFFSEKTTQKTTQKLNNNQLRILELVQKNPRITRNELANHLGITPDGVKYH